MLSMKEFLKNEVRPAYGCTEPGAVALAVARACEELEGDPITSVKVEVAAVSIRMDWTSVFQDVTEHGQSYGCCACSAVWPLNMV